MDLLLDTNALLWALTGDRSLGRAQDLVCDRRNRVYVSPVSAWEMAIKMALGKLRVPSDLSTWLPTEIAVAQFTHLPITLPHAIAVEHLPRHHADPFDRLLIAQATIEALTIVTGDSFFERYDVPIVRC